MTKNNGNGTAKWVRWVLYILVIVFLGCFGTTWTVLGRKADIREVDRIYVQQQQQVDRVYVQLDRVEGKVDELLNRFRPDQ